MNRLNTIFLLLLSGFLTACDECENLATVNLRLMNNSNATFTSVTVLTKGGKVFFENIIEQKSSEYKKVLGLSNSINLDIITSNQDTLRVIQIDPPRNENTFEEGDYTCQISIIDGRIQYDIIKD